LAGLNYVQAHQLGTEFGDSSDQDFSFSMSNFGFGLVPQVCPTATPTPGPPGIISVAPTSLSFPVTGVGPKPSSKQVTVDFTPTDAMAHTQNLFIDSNDPSHLTKNVSLAGTGQAGELSAPPSIKSSPARVGATASRPGVLRNRGKGALTGAIPTLGAPYSISPSGAFTIQAGKTLPITISFTPQTTGISDSSVNIAVDSPSAPQPGVTIQLRGSGK
jgi:hypothetical protein